MIRNTIPKMVRWLALVVVALGCDSARRTGSGPGTGTQTRTDTGSSTVAMDAGALADAAGMADTGAMTADTGVVVTDSGMMMGGPIPDPGTETNAEFTNSEPNDTPAQATPVGILTGPIWAGFVMPYAMIDNNTDSDFFVFKTGNQASLANLYIMICWSGAIDLLDLYLYAVDNNQQGAEVKTAATTDTSCETLINFGEGTTLLAAETTYLLEIRAGQGLDLGGHNGTYSA